MAHIEVQIHTTTGSRAIDTRVDEAVVEEDAEDGDTVAGVVQNGESEISIETP